MQNGLIRGRGGSIVLRTMTEPPSGPDRADSAPTSGFIATRRRPARWPLAAATALGIAVLLGWLLARLVWLPFYFGLFFYLVAGLLAGALSFRVGRPARPVSGKWLLAGVAAAAVVASAALIIWEYRYIAGTAGADGRFREARNAAVAEGRSPRSVEPIAAAAFRNTLREQYPPGGPLGYVRWAIDGEGMDLIVNGCRDHISINQNGRAWIARTVAGCLLLALGLWLSFESLRSSEPVSNILRPGEEAEEATS